MRIDEDNRRVVPPTAPPRPESAEVRPEDLPVEATLLERIDSFLAHAEEIEYTDTGDALELLIAARDGMRDVKEPNATKEPNSIEELRPEYYGEDDPYEPWKIIRALKMDFFQGNALKYILRVGRKAGAKREEDIQKAITYMLEWQRNGNSHE